MIITIGKEILLHFYFRTWSIFLVSLVNLLEEVEVENHGSYSQA